MDTRAQILATFSRYVPAVDAAGKPVMATHRVRVPDDKGGFVLKDEPYQRENEQSFLVGQTGPVPGAWSNGATVSEADLADWTAKGLAKAIDKPRDPLDHDGDGRRGGSVKAKPQPEIPAA